MSISGAASSATSLLTDGSNFMLNNLNLNNNRIINLDDPTNNQDAASKLYCDTNSLLVESNCLLINGANYMEADMDLNSHKIINLTDPSNTQDAATKNYIDTKFNGNNIFLGNASGSAVTTAINNTSLGFESLKLVGTGFGNTAVGYRTLQSNTSGSDNVGIGNNALKQNTIGLNNVAIGPNALVTNTIAGNNTAVGPSALFAYNGPNANTNNTAIGSFSLTSLTTGINNTAIGASTMTNVTTGNNNIVLGHLAGNAYTGAESNNILIGNQGIAGESGAMRIGGTNNRVFMAGVFGVTSSGGVPVYVNSSRQLGTVTSSRRFKENITDAKTYDISKLRVVNFNYIGLGPPGPSTSEIGLIAEEVEELYPELVAYDENNLPYTVKYMDLIPILLQKIQSLEKLIYRWSSDLILSGSSE
jgi:hypothetical protein